MSKRRIQIYIPLIQEFSSRLVFFHAAVASRLSLHLTDLKALHLLAGGSMSASALGEEVGLSLPAVTALIDRLEKAGFVVREKDTNDRRKVTVSVKPDGLDKVNRLYDGQMARMTKVISQYSADEFNAITDFLRRTNEVLREEAGALRSDVQS